jgi:hypothetical protein
LDRTELAEEEIREQDDRAAERCRVLAVRARRGDNVLRQAAFALGRTFAELAADMGMGTATWVDASNGKGDVPPRAREKLAALLRDANSKCTHCGATWWPPRAELCKWCGEPAKAQSTATVNGRRQPAGRAR